MAHHADPELLSNVLQLLTAQGHDGQLRDYAALLSETCTIGNPENSTSTWKTRPQFDAQSNYRNEIARPAISS